MSAVKTECPLSRAEFLGNAKPLPVSLDGVSLAALVKEFSTGSFGWYLGGKTSVTIDGRPVAVQIGLNLTVVGSKDAK